MSTDEIEACDRFQNAWLHMRDTPVLSCEVVKALVTASKVLRGHCNGRQQIVDLYIHRYIVQDVVDISQNITTMQSLKDHGFVEEASLTKEKRTLVVTLTQLLANFSACGEASRQYLFTRDLSSYSHVLSAAVMSGSRGAVAAFIAMIYNCLQSNGSENAISVQSIQQRCDKLSQCRSLLCQTLLAVLDNSKSTMNGHAVAGTENAPETEDPAVEWFHMLAFVWVRSNAINAIYKLVGPTVVTTQSRGDILPLTHEQLIILQLVSNVVEDPYFVEILNGTTGVTTEASDPGGAAASTSAGPGVFDSTTDVVGAGGMLDFILNLTHSMCALDIAAILGYTGIDASTVCATLSECEGDAADRIELQMRRELTADFLPLALQLLASTLACAAKDRGQYLREALATQTPLLGATVRILGGRDPGSRARSANQKGTTMEQVVAPTEIQLERSKLCVRATLQLLGNLVYGCDVAKDALRESCALAAVLSHCATDFANPVSREWALLCVRNACETHIANQTFIQELRPQEVVIQDEKLKAQGLRVEMNTETGQFKFVNTKDATSNNAGPAGDVKADSGVYPSILLPIL